MKILKALGLVIITGAIIYAGAILLGFNLPRPGFLNPGIEGEVVLKVTLLMDNNVRNPLDRIEVDVAKNPGPPPKGGVAVTDETGTATFKLKPSSYYIFFNDNSFPKNLAVPALEEITVVEGVGSERTILVTTRK
jgi:hypothetical protein